MAGRRSRLSRDKVLRAALVLADQSGLAGLTMQNIAGRLDAEAMSLYRHVRDKDEILSGLIDLVFDEIELPGAGADWKTSMRQRSISVRAALTRHPWALGLLDSIGQPGPSSLSYHDAVLGKLHEAGFSGLLATHAYNLVDSYTYGFVLQAQTLPIATPEDLAIEGEVFLGQLPVGEYPYLEATARELLSVGYDYEEEFVFGLDLILDALERLPHAQPERAGHGAR
jgi:AcrR family transcriptional regulator